VDRVTCEIKEATMTKIQILGSGCAKCHRLTAVTEQAAQELGLQYELEKVTDVMRFSEFGVMVTPALVVDGVVRLSGRVPSLNDVKQLLA
jgi:small redox-active disulfide protein 2